MRERSPTLVLLAILAFLGIKALPSTPPPSPVDSSKGTAQAAAETPPGHGPSANNVVKGSAVPDFWRPLIEFFHTDPDKGLESWPGFPATPGWQIEFLIATVPDPADSRSGYQFDPLIDAIQRAVETRGYVLNSYYFPWPVVTGPKGAAPASEPPGRRVTLGAKDWLPLLGIQAEKTDPRRPQERQPGVLLFRYVPPQKRKGEPDRLPGEEQNRLLMVMLVGETATTGIHKEAFTAGLDLIALARTMAKEKARAGTAAQSGKEQLLVLGPYYSGSQSSLASAIRTWLQRGRPAWDCPITIISGSATALDQDQFCKQCKPSGSDAPVCLTATVIPERIVFRSLLSQLHLENEQAARKKSIAVLVESNTGFGRMFSEYVMGGAEQAVVFPFPLHIADVRAGYGKTNDPAKSDLPRLPSFGTKLRLPREQGSDPRDTEPSLYPDMTAVSGERQLTSMLATIAHEQFRYVVITASDVRDAIFLATLVRQSCPNVRLLFTAGDVMLSHPDYSYYLKGALVGSSYPLYPKNQHWSYPFQGNKRRLFFTSQFDQGYYNAAIALLNVNGGEKGWQFCLQEYGTPFKVACQPRPPIWISLIGQNGPLPLAVLGPTTAEEKKEYRDYVYSPSSVPAVNVPTYTPQQNSLWLTPFVALSLFVGAVGWGLGYVLVKRPRRDAGRAKEPTSWVGLFWPRGTASQGQQRLYVLVCGVALLVAYGYAALVYDIPAIQVVCRQPNVELAWWNWILPVITVLLVGGLLVVGGWGLAVSGLVATAGRKIGRASRQLIDAVTRLVVGRPAQSGPPSRPAAPEANAGQRGSSPPATPQPRPAHRPRLSKSPPSPWGSCSGVIACWRCCAGWSSSPRSTFGAMLPGRSRSRWGLALCSSTSGPPTSPAASARSSPL
jgi:hypothetical protein